MNDLTKSEFFVLINGSSQEITNQEMQHAYEGFMEQVETISQSETTYLKIYRILNNIRIELVFLQTLYRYEQGKKCPEICLSSEIYPIS